MIEHAYSEIPVYRQCELLDLSRSAYYYKLTEESLLNLGLMNLIDKQYTKTPFYGVPKMTAWLIRQGYHVNHKRIRRLMRKMGLEAVYPGPRLSIASKDHKKYSYLLRDLVINHQDQVWCADITYIKMAQGFIYLVVIMDWFSRYVLSWEISNTLDKDFCINAIERALHISKPDIFNSDQGSQFTSMEFTDRLVASGIRISMDGRGKVFDNIFVERLWRTVKYEEVYLHNYQTVREARLGLTRYFHFYNTDRPHESLGYKTPHEMYYKDSLKISGQANELIHLIQPHFLS